MQFNKRDYLIFNVEEDNNEKIKDFLRRNLISQRMIRKAIKSNSIYLNGKATYKNDSLKRGDELSIKFEEEKLNGKRQFKDLDIIFENEDLIFINKEPFMVTHTAKDDIEDTLLNYMCDYFYRNGINRKVRFVNRLDRDTSGIVIIAKNSYAQNFLTREFKENKVVKKYLAITEGIFEKKEGVIEEPIGLSSDGIKREVTSDGKYSKTAYRVIKEKNGLSFVELRLFTGRTHQIRVHLKAINHPIIGDSLYNKSSDLINRQALHSYYLKIKLPREEKYIEIKADLPEDFKKIITL